MTLQNPFYYTVGMGFLALAKIKNLLKGYSSPKPFDLSNVNKCIEYDISVVDHWLSHLRQYSPDSSLKNKNILELGPGSDLGIGMYLLSKGCSRYNACDVNPLMKKTPPSFYDAFLSRMRQMNPKMDISPIKIELKAACEGKPSRINYVVRDDFDVAKAFGESSIDMVFSQAAFEHFDDFRSVVSKLSEVCKPGAVLITEIDLRTHSRWIRENDPNNIYRYSDKIYNLFHFRGIPNRIRPYEKKAWFEKFGWTDISISPILTLNNADDPLSGMHKEFRKDHSQMDYLTVMFCARKL